MDLEDRITIATPEGVELELALAGLGSRFIAGIGDLTIQGLLILALAVLTGAFAGGEHANTVAFVIGAFVIWFLYPIAFEVLAAGRTPGKRLSHLRVVRDSGAPVDLPASAIRNLVRVLDGPLLAYLPTVISVALTAHHQRPGDIAGGTLVIRERPPDQPQPAHTPWATSVPGAEPHASWDVSAITPQELIAVRRFLERRGTLEPVPRGELAAWLADGLRAKVAGAPARPDPEHFLETLAQVKARRR